MRLLIRSEQMTAIEQNAEEKFVRRLMNHLLGQYPQANVTTPEDVTQSALAELPEETLRRLVEVGIERARRFGLTDESSIAVYTALMFEVAPNFDKHKTSQVVLNDQNSEPSARLDQLLEILTDKNWENIRAAYDAGDWQSRPLESEENQLEEEAKA